MPKALAALAGQALPKALAALAGQALPKALAALAGQALPKALAALAGQAFALPHNAPSLMHNTCSQLSQSITMEVVTYLALGAVAGLISGLFGLGGGIIIVPILIFAFHLQGIDPQISTHMAIATSLATIAVTSLSSIYTHHHKSSVRWDLVKRMSPGIVLGSIAGGMFALSLNGIKLQSLFGIFLVMIAFQMLFHRPVMGSRLLPGTPGLGLAGVGIGALSSLFGIGGGSLTTPFLSFFGIRIHQAVGTAAACGLTIALSSLLIYATSAEINYQLPEATIGYIFLPAWLGIILTSTPFARLGALLAHRLNGELLTKCFGIVALIIGARFIYNNLMS